MVINVANFFIVLITCFHMAPRCSLVTSKTNINRKYIKVPKRSRKVLTLSEKKKWYLTSLEAVLVFTVLTICAGVQNVTPMKNKGTLYVVITMMVAALKKYTEDWSSEFLDILASLQEENVLCLTEQGKVEAGPVVITGDSEEADRWRLVEREDLAVMICFTALSMAHYVCEISDRLRLICKFCFSYKFKLCFYLENEVHWFGEALTGH